MAFGNPVNPTTVGQALTNIATTAGENYKWAKTAYAQLAVSVGNLSAQVEVGITDASSQAQVDQSMQLLGGLIQFYEGTQAVANTASWVSYVAQMRGMQF